jgi:hypothetical protein
MSIGLVEWHGHVVASVVVVVVCTLGWQGNLLSDIVVSVGLVTWCRRSSIGMVVWCRRSSVGLVTWLAVCHPRVHWAGVALPRCRIRCRSRHSYIGLGAWCVVVVWVCKGWGQEGCDVALLMLWLSAKWRQTWPLGPCIAVGYINTHETPLPFTHLSHFVITLYLP